MNRDLRDNSISHKGGSKSTPSHLTLWQSGYWPDLPMPYYLPQNIYIYIYILKKEKNYTFIPTSLFRDYSL